MPQSKRKTVEIPIESDSTVGQPQEKALRWGSVIPTLEMDPVEVGTRESARGTKHVFGSFLNRESAESAYGSATRMGYGRDDVNILMSNETRGRFFPEDMHYHSKVAQGAGAGAAIGGTAIGVLGAIVAIGTTIALPGFGLVLAGPLVAGLAGAGAGGIAGGLIGALVGWGIPENDASGTKKTSRKVVLC